MSVPCQSYLTEYKPDQVGQADPSHPMEVLGKQCGEPGGGQCRHQQLNGDTSRGPGHGLYTPQPAMGGAGGRHDDDIRARQGQEARHGQCEGNQFHQLCRRY